MEHKARTKALSWLLSLALMLSLVPGMSLTAYAATWSGEGTESSPYLISSLDDLNSLRDSVNNGTDYSGKYFKLTADIDCGTDNWVPIGKSEMGMADITYYDFKGTFDGNGKTVTYHVADSSDDCIGLFAFFMNGATVKNLSVAGSISGSGEDYGGIVGRNYVGTIQNCSSSVSITGSDDCYGGIAGTNNGTIDHCVASGALIWNFTGRTGAYAAGITAVNAGTVNNCVSLCDISAENVSGSGYAGRVIAWQQSGTVSDCYYLSTANITGNNVNASNATAKTADELKAIGETAFSAGYTVYALSCGYGSHTHSFTYEASGDTITATCSTNGCTLENNTATLTIGAPLHTAVGDDKSADAQITDANNIKGDAAVSYYKATNDNTRGAALDPQTTAPTDGGKYWAEITLTNGGGGANDSATAHVVYTITDLAYTVTISDNLVGGTVAADKTSAKYGDTVKLTVTPETGFNIKTVKYNDTAITANGDVYSFTMPAANVTVSATFEGQPFVVTISNAITGGTVAVSSALENGQAKAGSEVTLTVNPTAGYQIGTVKYNDTPITASEGVYKFTMPTEAVTVSATFVGKDTSLTLSTAGDSGTTCTAKLLDRSYNEISSVTKKTGEEFILCINKDERYSYQVSFTPNATASMREFSTDDYKEYINSTKSESLNTSLYWVTMPGADAGSVNMTVTFRTATIFTILYQPEEGSNPNEVWVKFGYTENNEDKLVTAKMSKDAAMGNVAVWSLKMSAAFNPDKIAIATSESAAESADTQSATVSTTDSWSSITGGQYLIIGNNAKTVIAAFTADSDSANVDREATVISIGNNATYQIAICESGGSGSVTPPADPTKTGYDFVGWRGYEGIEVKEYPANTTQISVKENMVFSAVWQPKKPNVKLNLNGGTGIANAEFTVPYNDYTTLASLTPEKSGYSFAGWSVAKDVTEDGKLYTKGAPFDTSTKITADLELTAQWKHVHAYGYVQIGAVPSLATKYAKYAPYLHIKICGCGDVDLEAHSLNSDGVCACGYGKSATPSTAELNVSYVRQSDNYTMMAELPETVVADSEVSVSAPGKWGSLKFSKWQYSTNDGTSWDDLAAYTMLSFIIPRDIQLRALYVNATTVPEVSMSATTYATTASDGNLYNSILFQMNYKLPDGYTYVDAGVRSGDNAGISYYELKERGFSMDGETKAIAYSSAAVLTVLQGGYLTTFDTSVTEQYYAKRENSVLGESGMTPAKLADYMYQSKPINIKDPPLYWNYKPTVTGQSGSINALTPVGFAQRNDGNHYIYAIAYLTYKDSSGTTHTIYTPALATTLNGISSAGTVSKSGS